MPVDKSNRRRARDTNRTRARSTRVFFRVCLWKEAIIRSARARTRLRARDPHPPAPPPGADPSEWFRPPTPLPPPERRIGPHRTAETPPDPSGTGTAPTDDTGAPDKTVQKPPSRYRPPPRASHRRSGAGLAKTLPSPATPENLCQTFTAPLRKPHTWLLYYIQNTHPEERPNRATPSPPTRTRH